ncbi:MAG: molecular chaperone HtpG [Planctomycetota bacterium]|nr:MAG: molecular chaperone HtpG [Planctomycetota bacterium]
MAESGTISVSAENIFPIIKKALYSEHDIFMRELISNAADAITKHKKLALTGESDHKDEEPLISLIVDEKANTLTIKDNGLGMTADEIKKYINEVAFSSAQDFAELFGDDEGKQIIGHFGLGFYSSFMVADKVEIRSKSYKKDSQAVKWYCDGSVEFTLEDCDKEDLGTEIILHIADDSKEFLNDYTIKETIKKYCQFFPYKIQLGEDQLNTENPIFTRSPSEISDDDYKAFYKELYPMEQEPLFWIHLNFEIPVPIRGVLYFPKKSQFEANSSKIKLFCNKVFVTDETQAFLPEFLSLLQGVIDWPDMPLNVSRSALQGHPDLKKIGAQIIKKVADKLHGIHNNEKDLYENIWEDIHPFIKYGCMNDDKFGERMEKHVIFKSTDDVKFTNIDDYLERNYPVDEEAEKAKAKAKEEEEAKKDDKDEKAEDVMPPMPEAKTIYYASDVDAQSSHIEMFKKNNKEVLILDSSIDSHFVQWIEMKQMMKLKFVRIDSEVFDSVVDGEPDKEGEDKEEDKSEVAEIFKSIIKDDRITVEAKKLASSDLSAMVILPEFMRRMNEMQILQNQTEAPTIDTFTFVVNKESPVVQKVVELKKADRQDDLELVVNHILDLALISQRNFDPKRMSTFIARSNKILTILAK